MPKLELRETDVAVVGAGLAGLTATRVLVAAGVDAVVLEARDRVGGRTLNEPLGDGAVVELGGQWIGPTQDRLAALAGELGVATFPTYAKGENLFAWNGRLRRYRGTIPRINPAVLADTAQAMARLNRLARQVPAAAPWTAPRAEHWDAQTFATWLARNVPTAGGRALMRLALEGVWATDASEPSLLHVLFYISSAGGLERLTDTEGGAQQDRFVGGSQEIALRMAAALGDRVVLEAPVRAVEQDDAGVLVSADGVQVRARHAVVAIPPPLTARIAWTPAMPHARDALTQRMAMGSVVKAMAIYDEPFWRADGLSGQATRGEGMVKVIFDNSPPGGRPGVLLAFFEGRAAQQAMRLPQDERRRIVTDALAELFGARAARPERYVDKAWGQDEWSRGCYGAYLPPGAWTGFGPSLRAPVGRVHWAGAETATVWSGYMDGAVSSGERAAAEVLPALATGTPTVATAASTSL